MPTKPIKRPAPMPPPEPSTFENNEENILRDKTMQHQQITPEKRLSKLYKFISNDKKRPKTKGILKKTQNYQQQQQRQDKDQKRQHLQQQPSINITTTEQDPTYGFASRYSDSKSYFRTQNVDNTIPRIVQRGDLLRPDDVPAEGGGVNFRDVLFPLRSSNGSNKSNTSVQDAAAVNAENWCLPSTLKENFKDFNISSPPQKKRVKFYDSVDNLYDNQPPPPPPFEYNREVVVANATTTAGSRNTLRERIYDFFANLF